LSDFSQRRHEMHLHERTLRDEARAIADSDAATQEAWQAFLSTLDPESRARWIAMRAAPQGGATGVSFGDSAAGVAFTRYRYARNVAYVRALDALRWAEGQRTFLVRCAILASAPDLPAAGRLLRRPDRVDHEILVFRPDELTTEHVREALIFVCGVWEAQGLTPSSPGEYDVAPSTDPQAPSGVKPSVPEWVVRNLAASREITYLDSLRVPVSQVAVEIPPTVQLIKPQ
jgi:hypothetical protein